MSQSDDILARIRSYTDGSTAESDDLSSLVLDARIEIVRLRAMVASAQRQIVDMAVTVSGTDGSE